MFWRNGAAEDYIRTLSITGSPWAIFTGPAISSNFANDDILSVTSMRDGLTVMQYSLGNCGTVTHILANTRSNAGPYDADWLLREYQNPKLPFRRYPMNNHHVSGRLLTQHFTFNCVCIVAIHSDKFRGNTKNYYGKPYKFVVDVDSMPFDQSPEVVNKALELIHKRVALIYPDAEFNEILRVGYFEEQKMGYHDNGKAGLGNTVSSISFPIEVTGCELGYGRDVWECLRGGECQWRKKKGKGSTRVKLDLLLGHGDTMIMRGRDIQMYWEITPEHASTYVREEARGPTIIQPRKTPKNNTHPTPPAPPAPLAVPLLPAASIPAVPRPSQPSPPTPLTVTLLSSVTSISAVLEIRATSLTPSLRNLLAMESNWQQMTGIGGGSPENEIRPTISIIDLDQRLLTMGLELLYLASNRIQFTGVEAGIGMMSPRINNGTRPTLNEARSHVSQWDPLNRISSIRDVLGRFNVLGYGVDAYNPQRLGSHSLNGTIQPRNSATIQLMGS
ncbi:hypothetical protein RUND412_010205 [Rhizina undulata]